jgi:Zn-dependent M28 family amino/carboxypeptidase
VRPDRAPLLRRSAAALGLLALAAACQIAQPTSEPVVSEPPARATLVPPACASTDAVTIRGCVDPERWADDVRRIAAPRPPGSIQHLRVQSYCAEVFEQWGYEVEIDRYATGTNVLGRRPGRDPEAPYVLVGAHYDHVPGCDGADDNASGTAAVLELSRVLAGVDAERPLVVACWDEEERGLVGSRDWVRRARARGDLVFVDFNFDAIAFTDPRPQTQRVPTGFGVLFPTEIARLQERGERADFIALVADAGGSAHAERIAAHAEAIGLPTTVLSIPTLVLESGVAWDLQRSDHAAFWDAGYPAVMITDTADFRSAAYHCRGRLDTVDTLDLPFGSKVVQATAAAAAEALVTVPPSQ